MNQNEKYNMASIERKQRIEKLQRQLMEWAKESIPPDMLKSPEKMPEVLRIIARDRKGQLEEMIAALGPEAQLGLRLSTSDGDKDKGDIWLHAWPDKSLGIRVAIHGYQESSESLYIVRGAAHEEIYSPLSAGEKTAETIPVMKVPSFPTYGSTITVPPHYIHSLAGSEGSGALYTLNGFSPALRKVEIFEEEQNGESLSLRRVAAIEVDDRTTSVDFSPSGPR